MQSRLGSFVEAWINVIIGFSINFAANMVFLPLLGFNISVTQNLTLGCIYTIISVARSYAIRRWFNGYIVSTAAKLSGG